jgi:hypothetical protein
MSKQVEYGVFMPVGEGGWIRSITAPPVPATYAYKQIPRSLRQNPLPVKRINRSLLMGHENPAGTLV